jgi:hypothetical protein
MSRKWLVGLALGAALALGLAASAWAASLNTYTGSVLARQSGAGSVRAPVALGLVVRLSTHSADAADVNAAPLTDLTLTLPEVGFNSIGFPVCPPARIVAAQTDAGCPPGARVGTGKVTAALWSPAAPTQTGTPCPATLDVWNAGARRLTYFLVIPPGHGCAGLMTGAIPPWTGTLREAGTTLSLDVPLPPAFSTDAGGLGLYLALDSATLTFVRLTHTTGSRTTPFLESLGCVAGQRPYTLEVQASQDSSAGAATLRGSGRC